MLLRGGSLDKFPPVFGQARLQLLHLGLCDLVLLDGHKIRLSFPYQVVIGEKARDVDHFDNNLCVLFAVWSRMRVQSLLDQLIIRQRPAWPVFANVPISRNGLQEVPRPKSFTFAFGNSGSVVVLTRRYEVEKEPK